VIGERDLSVSFMTDFTKESNDVASVAAAGEITARYNDAKRYCKTALARGMDHTLSPTLVCRFTARLACSLIAALSIQSCARRAASSSATGRRPSSWAHASHAGTGRDLAKRFGVAYDWNRLVSDPVYNTQIGAAEVAALLKEYRGSHIMPRAGYNARSQGRCGRLGRAHSVRRDAQLCAARNGESPGLFRPFRRQQEPNLLRAAPVGWQANPMLVYSLN
jgi:soluble lytic murein transglycosylase